ncbi:MAG: hypothetical protein KKB37_05780 [Alphaproteobacteria bacterium]|nr:hypothetical protein [Alphaproteobacteria bacterium]
MSAADTICPHGRDFEPFLHATVGKDRNGHVVTVLSTLARLGLDPWKEAAELAALGGDAARSRLGLLLSRFRDVPALGHDHGSVARELTLLLPACPGLATTPGATVTNWPVMSSLQVWAVVAVLLLLLQMMFTGAPNSGG